MNVVPKRGRGTGRRGRGGRRLKPMPHPLNRAVNNNYSLGSIISQLDLKDKSTDMILNTSSRGTTTCSSIITNNGLPLPRLNRSAAQRLPFLQSSVTASRSNKTSSYTTQENSTNSEYSAGTIQRKGNKITPGLKNSYSGNKSSSGRSRITPSSLTSNSTYFEPKMIVAITEGRGAAKGEVGIAAIDLKRPHLLLCQLSDTHTYIHTLTKLNFFNPIEIIVPHTFNNGSVMSELYKLIQDHFPKVNLISIQRSCFSDSIGLQYVRELSVSEANNIQLLLVHKFYALTAIGALLKYIENIICVTFAPQSLKIEYQGSKSSVLIDMETSIKLELVESLASLPEYRCSLLSIMNYTYTIGGLRNLRANILQPPCDESIINARLDCIEELLQNNEVLLPAMKRVLKQFVDVEKILWLCMLLPVQDGDKSGEAQLNQVLQLKATMDALPVMIDALQNAKSKWFQKIKKDLEDPRFTEIAESIKRVIQDDVQTPNQPNSHFQRCFAVRPCVNSLLDVARKSYSEAVTDIQEKVTALGETYGLPLRLHCNSSKGFHIILTIGQRNSNQFNYDDLPSVFLEVQNHGSTITMTTQEILLLDGQSKEVLNDVQMMSNVVITELLTELRAYMNILYKLCEHVADLDLIVSLAQISTSTSYIRPTFDKYLELKDSTHPTLECVLPSPPVPNNIYASPENNFNIITGPNMGGKSIYIKQIALLQIMAQVGCFVPAAKAIFRITDHIFSRIGFNDSIESNASSYVLEMKEIQYIMQRITPTSLVIIDELCRGTSCEEGASMAWAICEYLLNTNAFTFFTTHFLNLTRLESIYFNVQNLHADTEIASDETSDTTGGLNFKYKIIPGITKIDHYGLRLAKSINLPEHVISLTESLMKIVSNDKKPIPECEMKDKSDYLIYKLGASLMDASRKFDDSSSIFNDLIRRFKYQNPQLMDQIEVSDESKIIRDKNDCTSTTKNETSCVNTTDSDSNSLLNSAMNYNIWNRVSNNSHNSLAKHIDSRNVQEVAHLNEISNQAKNESESTTNTFQSINTSDSITNLVYNSARVKKIWDRKTNKSPNFLFKRTISRDAQEVDFVEKLRNRENKSQDKNEYMNLFCDSAEKQISDSPSPGHYKFDHSIFESRQKEMDCLNNKFTADNYTEYAASTVTVISSEDIQNDAVSFVSVTNKLRSSSMRSNTSSISSDYYNKMFANYRQQMDNSYKSSSNENVDYESIFCEPDIHDPSSSQSNSDNESNVKYPSFNLV